jgi:hypothetical protein
MLVDAMLPITGFSRLLTVGMWCVLFAISSWQLQSMGFR